MEGKKYPFFGLQWHPEKSNYEWSPLQNINREPMSVIVGNIIGNFFVEYCRHTNAITSQTVFDKYNINKLGQYQMVNENSHNLGEVYDDPLYVYILE